MNDLASCFITTERPWKEGAVEAFEQVVDATGTSGLVRAELRVTALGVYEASLDGEKVGDQFLAPGLTYYPRELHEQRYDLTRELGIPGTHVLRVLLGQGWYCGRFTFENKVRLYGDRPAVGWALSLAWADGSVREITSRDPEVRAVASGFGYAGLYDGEVFYAPGAPWPVDADETESDPLATWPPVPYTGPLPERILPSTTKVTVQEELPVRGVTHVGNATIVDFGQNFAGIVELDPSLLAPGARVALRHGEILNPDGSLYTANLRKAKARCVYQASGDPAREPRWRPRFTYMGFRYVELTGAPWAEGLLSAFVVSEDLVRTGHFACENRLVQRLYENQVWGQRSNYLHIPTDCPQRDERQGYTGDAHVFARTGAFNYDTELFLEKFLSDIRAAQLDGPDGYVGSTAPAVPGARPGFLSMLGWGNATCIIPDLIHEQFGSARAFEAQYESMRSFVECELARGGRDGLWGAPSLGDWLMLGRGVAWLAMHHGPVSHAFVVNDLRIMAKAARILGRDEDARRWEGELGRVRDSYLKKHVRRNGIMKDDYQGAYLMALALVVESGELWDRLFANLVDRIRRDGMQTGFFSTQYVLGLLAEHGQERLAYDLLLQGACPGWMYEVERGATTVWERWDALRPDGGVNEDKMSGDNMVSFNHYAFGSVGEFYYRHILGIQAAEPGFSRVRIRPVMDERLGHVRGSYDSRAGRIEVSWACKGSSWELEVTLPADGEVRLPDGRVAPMAPGTRRFFGR